MEWMSTLFSIIVIDLVLAGDNALLIGMAARNLPKTQQKKAIIWGTGGAVLIRILATFLVVWLLDIPGLLLAGGLILIWIAYKLLIEKKEHNAMEASGSLFSAIRTIVIADAVMGLDNVLAIAGAAHGHLLLIVIGLLISVPIVVWGSTLVMRLIERFPVIIYLGSAVLAYTSGKMITGEPWLKAIFAGRPELKWLVVLAIVAVVLVAGKIQRSRQNVKGLMKH